MSMLKKKLLYGLGPVVVGYFIAKYARGTPEDEKEVYFSYSVIFLSFFLEKNIYNIQKAERNERA
ncbi:MAG: hypothetical protein Q8P67_04460 [archaeon]|nr:hypothetical protein [archaeon]